MQKIQALVALVRGLDALNKRLSVAWLSFLVIFLVSEVLSRFLSGGFQSFVEKISFVSFVLLVAFAVQSWCTKFMAQWLLDEVERTGSDQ